MMLSPRSRLRIAGVHPDLVRVVELAAEGTVPFIVTEGLRTRERQDILLAEGKSRLRNSRHLYGLAVDLAVVLGDGTISWVRDDYKRLAVEVKLAAVQCGIPVFWGGNWPTFYDGCHFELSREFYPDPGLDLSSTGEVTQT